MTIEELDNICIAAELQEAEYGSIEESMEAMEQLYSTMEQESRLQLLTSAYFQICEKADSVADAYHLFKPIEDLGSSASESEIIYALARALTLLEER